MNKKIFALVVFASINLATSVFAMQPQTSDWLELAKKNALFCRNASDKDFICLFHGLACSLNSAFKNGIRFGDEHINPIILKKGKPFFGLHEAAQYGHVDLVRAYLKHRIDPHKKGPDSKTPKELAEHFAKQAPNDDQQNYVDIISLLKNAGQEE